MKRILIACFSLIPFISFTQIKGDITINWSDKTEMFYGDSKINIPQFTGNNYNYENYKKALFYSLNLNTTTSLSGKTAELTNIVYESILTSAIGDLDPENIPTTPSPTLRTTKSRGLNQSFLSLSPIVKDESGYKRIKSFSYTINTNSSSSSNSSSRISKNSKVTSGIENSVLASGNWYQFYVEKSGVYKITKSFLEKLGIDVSEINPTKLKIYGNGGRMLPLLNSTYYPTDLTENAIEVIGESDGVFDSNDYILFYAEGVDTWSEESQTSVNLYSTKSYYYVTVTGGDGKRISNMSQPSASSTVNISTYDEYQFHESDLTNIANVGRQWFGESFQVTQDQEFSFDFPNIDTTSDVKLNITTAAVAYTSTTFTVTANGVSAGTITIPALSTSSSTQFNTKSLTTDTSIAAAENIIIKLSYNNNGVAGTEAYLDNIRLVAKSKLQGYGKQFLFQYDDADSSSEVASYNFSNASALSEIWDVTDTNNATKVENSDLASTFSFKTTLGEVRKYVAIDPSDYYTPTKTSSPKIANQDIKGTVFYNSSGEFEDIDYVIITPNSLYNQAEELAAFHRNNSGLNVQVITLEKIYHEFSSGKQDVAAIRNCIKYIYNNASSTDNSLKYVCLFGDASYDYKDITSNNTNIVPIYEALNSNTIGESSFATDDFYGLMDDEEGYLVSNFGGIDIAVGRMLNNDSSEAEEMVNKVIEYHASESYGRWRNNFVMISDDSDKASDSTLQDKQNALADTISAAKPFMNVTKILLDSYTQETSSGGSRYPDAKEDIISAFGTGALVINYLGHGGEDGLATERIWEKTDSQELSNQYKYPLFITITCDFSRFDNPSTSTAGEYIYWNAAGGAISLITTIREIGQTNAEIFNNELAENLFSYDSNEYTSIAEALRISKNANPNSSTNVVCYIGDPALMLSIAKPDIKLTKINDVAITDTVDPFEALATMKITGEVTDENGSKLTSYNGELYTIISDKTITRTTLNNDGYSPAISFSTLGETFFRGNASITNGEFEFSFIVPKDILISVDTGKISFYAKKTDVLENQTGYDTSIIVGGLNEDAPDDDTSPTVQLYMNDETFVSGGTTNSSPYLLAILEDESGLNTSSGIGHDMEAILDGDEDNPYTLNDYYETDLDDFTKGSIKFPFTDLEEGLHTLTFTAWDVYNNSVTSEIQFVVAGDDSITLTHVLNYPNPFVNYTQFWFSHNRPYEALEVQVQVMTITGKVVWTQNQTITTEGFLSREITWDGKDDFGNKLGKGVYIYKLTVKSNVTNSKAEKYEKLVIL
jgi:hypothetical protein